MPRDWQESANRRRDYRADRSQPNPEKLRRKHSTAKWCRGRVGVSHEWIRGAPVNLLGWWHRVDVCGACGKRRWQPGATP